MSERNVVPDISFCVQRKDFVCGDALNDGNPYKQSELVDSGLPSQRELGQYE